MVTPVFVHRFRKWRRRHAGPLALRVLFAVAAGTALVAGMEYLDRRGQGEAPASSVSEAGPPAAAGAPLSGADKLAERMEAAVKAQLRTSIDADLSVLPAFEVPPPLRSIDGTSFRHGDETVRIDAVAGPAAADICRDGAALWSCGLQARVALHNLVARRPILCQPRRTLAEGAMGADCRLQARDGLPAGDMARRLVRQGWARPLAAREADFAAELGEAKAAGNGLWRGGWTVVSP